MSRLLVKNAAQLLTCAGGGAGPVMSGHSDALDVVEGGAVFCEDGLIKAVGTTKEVLASIDIDDDAVIIDASGKVVMPGFVDPHTHLVFAGSREDELVMKIKGATYLEILAKGGGILRTVRATREAGMERLLAESRARLDRMLAYGTTTAEAKSGYGLDTETELKMLRAIRELDASHPVDLVPTFLGAHALPPEYKDDRGAYVDLVAGVMMDRVAAEGLAEFCDVFCEKGVFTVEETRKILSSAKQKGIATKLHVDEVENLGGAALAAELGALTAEHLVRTREDEMEKMAEAGVIACLLPGTPFVLMNGHYSPARKFIEKGVAVALATDLNPNCWTESMQMVMTLACLNMKMSPEEAIIAATRNAAYAIARGDSIGTLEVGKKADVLVMDAPNYMHLPYRFGTNLAEMVVKSGSVVSR